MRVNSPVDLRAQAVPDPGGDFLLRLEVVVDGSLGKAGGVNNVLQRCVGIAFFRKERGGGVQDFFLRSAPGICCAAWDTLLFTDCWSVCLLYCKL